MLILHLHGIDVILLSKSMIQNEIFQVYESPYYYTTTTKRNAAYSIISLKECQGFIFNQDLFATPFQQLRSLAIENTIIKTKETTKTTTRKGE